MLKNIKIELLYACPVKVHTFEVVLKPVKFYFGQ